MTECTAWLLLTERLKPWRRAPGERRARRGGSAPSAPVLPVTAATLEALGSRLPVVRRAGKE